MTRLTEASFMRRASTVVLITAVIPTFLYFTFLLSLITLPSLQAHLIYLHSVGPGGSDPAILAPERVGFLHKQVTQHSIASTDGVNLSAWHILPLELYHKGSAALLAQDEDQTTRGEELSLKLLSEDSSARLIIYMHGVAGNVASGRRPESYRAIVAGSPPNTHVLSFDYRGFGLSASSDGPAEEGIIEDALAAFQWATDTALVPPERIVLVGQSLGTAVTLALADELAGKGIYPAGIILNAPFSDMATLTSTYRILGHLPVLSPIARFKPLFDYFSRHLQSKWLSVDRIENLVRQAERFHLILVHSEDDTAIPSHHTERLVWHAVNAIKKENISFEELKAEKMEGRIDLGEAGWSVALAFPNGFLKQVMLKHANHDKAITYPVVALEIAEAFRSVEVDV